MRQQVTPIVPSMEGVRRSQLISKLLRRSKEKVHLENRHTSTTGLDVIQQESLSSAVVSEGTTTVDEEDLLTSSPIVSEESRLSCIIDLRYGGQCLTPEQLPQFCEQVHNLVNVIRNIQSYGKITGEYPRELERRLEAEAREVAALVAEAQNARDVVERARAQRRAVKSQRKHVVAQLAVLKETEMRELENVVRVSERKLFKNWETVRDSIDPVCFEPLLDEIKSKQTALDCLVRLVEGRRAYLTGQSAAAPTATALARNLSMQIAPVPLSAPDDHTAQHADGRRASYKRRRKEREARSVPLSSETSHHTSRPEPEFTSRERHGSTDAVTLDLSSNSNDQDILLITCN